MTAAHPTLSSRDVEELRALFTDQATQIRALHLRIEALHGHRDELAMQLEKAQARAKAAEARAKAAEARAERLEIAVLALLDLVESGGDLSPFQAL